MGLNVDALSGLILGILIAIMVIAGANFFANRSNRS